MAVDSDAPIKLLIAHSGQTVPFAFPPSTSMSSIQSAITTQFRVPPSAQKLLIKGRKLDLSNPDIPLATLLGPASSSTTPHKVLLIGPASDALASFQADEALRQRKHDAFEHHAHAPKYKVKRTGVHGVDESANYKFHEVVPFPESVPSFEARRKMLDRLAADEAVKDVMKTHKYVVGRLTELHPHVNPDLLGLNKNAGQEICLRLLTNDLSGTRAYLDVRKVLLHELTHNDFGDHDDEFKTRNSELNAEVVSWEHIHGGPSQGLGAAAAERAWEPEHQDEVKREGRRLNEKVEERAVELLRMTAEDEVEERRERARMAAEARMKAQGQGR